MKKILNFILKDITASRRDNVVLYMIFAPLLIAFIMRLFIPSFESSTVSFAVDGTLENSFRGKLEDYGNVISYETGNEVRTRVDANDDVIGIIRQNDGYMVILEGNENREIRELAYVVIDNIARGGNIARYNITSMGDTRSLIKEYAVILIILMIVMMAGMVVGFNIIDEKESGAIRAIAVTPLRLWEYLAARGIQVMIFTIALSILSSMILIGFRIDYAKILLGAVFCSGTGIFLGILIGGIADNQIKGIALVKVLALPFTLIPISSIFIPEKWQVFLYIFPNYWMFRIFKNIFIEVNNPDFWLSSAVTILITLILMLLLVFAFRKKLKLK
ncbi:MAG: ABC transporter permease [Actinobacteria bacterium]|nr:ABC transporter permease [Actinomycetota bacterium]